MFLSISCIPVAFKLQFGDVIIMRGGGGGVTRSYHCIMLW